jgi:large subunit ribosomal protein L4
MYLANQREGNAAAKTRAEVAGSTKKIYKQKGTGNARHGSRRAPLFRGGGVVGGPKPAEHRLEFSKTQRKGALLSAVAYQIQQGTVSILTSDVSEITPKTKTVAQFLAKTNMTKGSTLFVLSDAKATGFIKSARNIKNVDSTHMGSLNVHSLLEARHIVVVAEAFKSMQHMFTK